jgi:hypothetical protein
MLVQTFRAKAMADVKWWFDVEFLNQNPFFTCRRPVQSPPAIHAHNDQATRIPVCLRRPVDTASKQFHQFGKPIGFPNEAPRFLPGCRTQGRFFTVGSC